MDNLIPKLYKEYGEYVNQSRAFPLSIDGLKPVERRILYSTYLIAREKNVKSAKIDGYCFTGDTKIKLAAGDIKTIKELYDEKYSNFYIFAYDIKSQKPVITKADGINLTKYVDKIIQITTESGVIKCTEDHPWLTKLGSYKKAKNLKIGDSLETMEFGITDKNNIFKNNWMGISGYEAVESNGFCYLSHVLADEFNCRNGIEILSELKTGFDRHHIDFNQLNNNPENIKRLLDGEHSSIHATDWIHNKGGLEFLSEHGKLIQINHPEIAINLVKYTKNRALKDPNWLSNNAKKGWDQLDEEGRRDRGIKIGSGIKRFYQEHGSQEKSEATKKYWDQENENVKDHREKNRQSGIKTSKTNFLNNHKIKILKTIKSVLSKNLELNKENYNLSRSSKSSPLYSKILSYFNSYEEAVVEARKYTNHTVLNIETIILSKSIPVYDVMNSKDYHNFVVMFSDNTGVVVSNCLGNFHPHSSCYSSIVQLVRQGFLTSQGNFGTNIGADPDPPAASRYTECGLSRRTIDLAFRYIDTVPLVESELEDEPKFIPTMFPFCLIGNEYTIGIGFGYRTFIPCYKVEDLHKRLLYLLGKTKTKPTIKPISDCKILSSNKDLEQLLTTGKATIRVKGEYETIPMNCKVIIKSWPPGKRFEGLLSKFSKELENQDIGYNDESSTETNIVFEVLKQRSRDEIFKKFIGNLDEVLEGNISFDNVIVDENNKVKVLSIDEMLLNTYKMFTTVNQEFLKNEIKSLNDQISELEILEKIRPSISKHISVRVTNIELEIEKISKETKVDKNIIKGLLGKYRISKLFTFNTETKTLQEKLNLCKQHLSNIQSYVLDQYQVFIGK